MSTLIEKTNADKEEGFEGFETESNASQTAEREPEDIPTEEESSEMTTVTTKTVSEDEIGYMVDQVVDKITPIIQACCITDRLEKAERNAEEWKSFANLMMKNPQFATRKLSMNINDGTNAAASIGKHPMEQPWDIFIQTPLAAPIWTLIIKLDLHPNSSIFTKWWKRIKSDTRSDMWSKLSKYLQAIRYYNSASDEFWRKYSMNPTYYSIQKLCTDLVTQSNWLRASGLELPKVCGSYIQAATDIATSTGQVSEIDRILAQKWPAGFKPFRLHYDNEPFENAVLFSQEDENLCDNTAVLKGFDFAPTEFRATNKTNNIPSKMTKGNVADTKPSTSDVSRMIAEILKA